MSKKQKILIGVLTGILAVLVVIFALYSSYAKKKLSEEEATVEKPSVAEIVEEEKKEEAAQPEEITVPTGPASVLTGLPLEHADAEGRRLVAVMFENTKAALPHAGINRAGIIYECPMEGGISRFMAVYDDYDGLDIIGNIRSCRPYFAYLAAEYDAVYLHFGQSVQGRAVLDTGIVDELNGLDGSVESQVFFRTSDRKAPHNSFASAAGIDAGIAKKGFDTKNTAASHFTFSDFGNSLPGGSDCKALTVYYPNGMPYFIYDDETKTYKRYEFSAPETDSVDGEQLAVTNIIIEQVPVSNYEGYEYLNIPITGSGTGKFITNGRMTDITWSKAGNSEITHYYMPDGSEIALNPGKTWICLESSNACVKNTYYATQAELQK